MSLEEQIGHQPYRRIIMLSKKQIAIIDKLPKEYQTRIIEMIYIKTFMEWINDYKVQKE